MPFWAQAANPNSAHALPGINYESSGETRTAHLASDLTTIRIFFVSSLEAPFRACSEFGMKETPVPLFAAANRVTRELALAGEPLHCERM